MNSTSRTSFEPPSRPLSVFIVTLWSLARAILCPVGIYGIYLLAKDVTRLNQGFFHDFLTFWTDYWPIGTKLIIIFAVIRMCIFFLLTFGILFGQNWGRVGFLWMSVAVLVWNARAFIVGRFVELSLAIALDSLIALCLASWYFRRPDILTYYEVEEKLPKRSLLQVGKFPLDLSIALGLGVFRILGEVLGFLSPFS